ncbi:MAG: phosphoserine phosphatase SerB [Bacteriovoracia bacterium]
MSGNDHPGITSQLTGILAQGQATILDIGQAVIHGLLSLSILFQLKPEDEQDKTVIKDLLFKATELGLKLEFQVLGLDEFREARESAQSYRYALTLIGEQVTATALHEVTAVLAKFGLNIDRIQRLSDSGFSCVELLVSSTRAVDQSAMKKQLLQIAQNQAVDVALQAEGLFRRAKRLVVFDMDSTLIRNEVIDELARERGVYDEVSAITHAAMKGQMNFDQSLSERCAKLKGANAADFEKVFARIEITPGAIEMFQVLRRLGYKTALISGGFTFVADRLKEKLGIDYVYANQLEVVGGAVTGKVFPPIINAQRKADLLEVIAQQERISLDQVIAVGDGANDLLMLEKAGLGIAFNAKPLVSAQAKLSLNQKNLRSIFYLLGLSGRDVAEAML